MNEKKKVLALDDQKSMQNILNFALKKDFNISVVGKANDALNMAEKEEYDFILLDITLDDDLTDGIGVAQLIQDAGINVPTAFLSSMTRETLSIDQQDRVKTLRNIKFYQTKPISPQDLIKKIKDITG